MSSDNQNPSQSSPSGSGEHTPVALLPSSPSSSSLESHELFTGLTTAATSIFDLRDETKLDPFYVSEFESEFYYHGLGARPHLVYRSDYTTKFVTAVRKQLLPVYDHVINDSWQQVQAWQVVKILDDRQIPWQTIDVVRFKAEDDASDPGGPIIWISVENRPPLDPKIAHLASQSILSMLTEIGIDDVDVHFRQGTHVFLAGTPLASPVDPLVEGANVIGATTPTLGLSIALAKHPEIQGTLGLYMASKDRPGEVFGLTCSHVAIGTIKHDKDFRHHPSQPAIDLIHLGPEAYTTVIYEHEQSINRYNRAIVINDKSIENSRNRGDPDPEHRATLEAVNAKSRRDIQLLQQSLARLRSDWKDPTDRIIGRVIFAPRLEYGVDKTRYAEDWGLVRLKKKRLGPGFQGNVINLATTMRPFEFEERCSVRDQEGWNFVYPTDGLLRLRGVIPDEELVKPDMFEIADADGKVAGVRSLLVVKNGSRTGVTIGRANGLKSVVKMGSNETALAWCILGYNNQDDFSKTGDSGSIIADLKGRIGGLLMSGNKVDGGRTELTYAVPFHWLKERVKERCEKHGLRGLTFEVDSV